MTIELSISGSLLSPLSLFHSAGWLQDRQRVMWEHGTRLPGANENAMIVEAWTNARDLEPVVEIHLRAAYDDWTYYDTIDLEHIGAPPRTTVLRVMDVSRFSDGSSELALAVVFDGQETETVIPFTQDKGSQKLVRKPVSPEPGKLA